MSSYSSKDNLQEKAESKDTNIEHYQSSSSEITRKKRPKPVLVFGIIFIAIGVSIMVLGGLAGLYISVIPLDGAMSALNDIPTSDDYFTIPSSGLDPALVSLFDSIREIPEMHRLPNSNELLFMTENVVSPDTEQIKNFMIQTLGIVIFLLVLGYSILFIGKTIISGNRHSKTYLVALLIFSGAAIPFAGEAQLYTIGFCVFVGFTLFYLRAPKVKEFFVKKQV